AGDGNGSWSSMDSTAPSDTLLEHGNYDTAGSTQRWDPGIPDHTLPNSYYLSSKPSFWGSLLWPPFDPGKGMDTANDGAIPAGLRFIALNGGAPTPPSNLRKSP